MDPFYHAAGLEVDPPTVPLPRGVRLCTVPGCYRPRTEPGFCAAHGARYRRWGNPCVTLLRAVAS